LPIQLKAVDREYILHQLHCCGTTIFLGGQNGWQVVRILVSHCAVT